MKREKRGLAGTAVTRRGALMLAGGTTLLFASGCSFDRLRMLRKRQAEEPELEEEPEEEPEPEPEPEPAEENPAEWEQVELDPAPAVGDKDAACDWHWVDGVLATSIEMSGLQAAFAVWSPVTGLRFDFSGTLLNENETDGRYPFITATYGEDPAVWLVTTVRIDASGLDPEQVQVYAQRLNFEEQTLGERIVMPESITQGSLEVEVEHLTASQSHVAFRINVGEGDDKLVTLDKEGLFEERGALGPSQHIIDYGICFDAGSYVWMDPEEGSWSRISSIDDGTVSVDISDWRNSYGHSAVIRTAYHLGGNQWCILNDGWYTLIVSGGTSVAKIADVAPQLNSSDTPADYDEMVIWNGDCFQLSDGSLVVELDDNIVHLSEGPTVETILDRERVQALDAEICGVDPVLGEIYLRTSDEQVIMSLEGEDVGRWTCAPESGDEVMTDVTQLDAVLWLPEVQLDYGRTYRAVVTRGGQPK